MLNKVMMTLVVFCLLPKRSVTVTATERTHKVGLVSLFLITFLPVHLVYTHVT